MDPEVMNWLKQMKSAARGYGDRIGIAAVGYVIYLMIRRQNISTFDSIGYLCIFWVACRSAPGPIRPLTVPV